jgi:amino acid transporter
VLVVVWVGVWALLRHTAGLHFMQAQANLGSGNPTVYGAITSLNAQAGGLGYGIILSGDPISKIFFAVAVPAAEIAVNLAFIAVTTRVLFAQAFDRLLPIKIAQINERNHAPMNAIGIVLIVSIAFAILQVYVTLTNIVALESLFFALILLSGGVAATFLPLRRPDLVTKAGATDVQRLGGVPTITRIGLATTVLALFTVIEVIIHSNGYGKCNAQSIITLVVLLLAGPVIYLIARTVRKRNDSLDLDMAMRELPPE